MNIIIVKGGRSNQVEGVKEILEKGCHHVSVYPDAENAKAAICALGKPVDVVIFMSGGETVLRHARDIMESFSETDVIIFSDEARLPGVPYFVPLCLLTELGLKQLMWNFSK